MKRKLILLLIISSLFLFIGCSDKPSDKEIEEQLIENFEASGISELIEVEAFYKMNGYKENENTYVATVRYMMRFKYGLDELQTVNQGLFDTFFIMALRMKFGNFKKDDRGVVERDISLKKTEKGWRIIETLSI